MNKAKAYLYDFCFAVSQDLKNPYTSTAQLAKMMQELNGEKLNEEICELLGLLVSLCMEAKGDESITSNRFADFVPRGGFVRRSVAV